MGYALGVDLGTTYTAAAIARNGHVEMATLGDRGVAVPSVLFLRDDGEMLVGEAALRRGLTEPNRLAREFKRRLGDPAPMLLGGTPVAADALMGHLLAWVVDHVSSREGGRPDRITVTHPANWGPYKRELLDQAVARAGVRDIAVTMTEPDAAATHYASMERLESGAVVAVYDLGGGTFDATLLRKRADGFDLIGSPEGLERTGGIDFDEAVFGHVVEVLGDTLTEMDPDDPRVVAALARLRDDCVTAKEALSSDTDVAIPVLLPSIQTEVRLTRAEFEAMIRPTLVDTVDSLERALRSAHVPPSELHAVLLVGGSSRIPLVGELVSHRIGRPVAVDVHPKHAVALGAALHAAPAPAAPTAPEPPAETAAVDRPPADATPADADATPLLPPRTDTAPVPAASGRRRGPILAVVAVVAVLAIAGVVFALTRGGSGGGGGGSASSGSSNSTDTTESTLPPRVPVVSTVVNDGAGKDFPTATFEVSETPFSVLTGGGAGWVVARDAGKLLRIDPTSDQTVAVIETGPQPRDASFGAGSVWTSNADDNTITRFDAATNQKSATIPMPDKPGGIVASDTAVWVALENGRVIKIDAATNQIQSTIDVGGGGPSGMALGAGKVWMADAGLGALVRIDEATGNVDNIVRTGASPLIVTFGAGAVWVQDNSDNTVTRVDPDRLVVVATIPFNESIEGLVVAGNNVWAALPNSNAVARIDVSSNKVAGKVQVGEGPTGLAFGLGTLWVSVTNNTKVARLTV